MLLISFPVFREVPCAYELIYPVYKCHKHNHGSLIRQKQFIIYALTHIMIIMKLSPLQIHLIAFTIDMNVVR